jgi:transposase-like protein
MADDYPANELEFTERFAAEADCRAYLEALRWPDGFVCSRCGGRTAWKTKRQQYLCAACQYPESVTAGTIFQDTHKPLRLWFRAGWYVTGQKYGASALGLQRVLGLGSYLTAWSWLHKLRRAMVRPGRDALAGRVEVDETYVGGMAEGKRGRGSANKALVIIAAEEDGVGIGRIRMARIRDASAESLLAFIRVAVTPGSQVHTDGWDGYAGLAQQGYRHEISRLCGQGKEAATELLPRVHRVASLLKRWLLGTHQGAVRPDHLDYYLDEFTFRFNRRTSRSRGKLFYRLLQQAVQVEPSPYKAMVGGKPLSSPPQPVGGTGVN